MGIAASLFYSSNDSEKQTLHRRITPSAEQYEAQQKRWKDLAEFLKGSIEDSTELPVKWWLQGSYKFGTQIRPMRLNDRFDIDLGIYLCWDGTPDEGPYDASEQKSFVQLFLLEFARDNDEVEDVLVPPKERCCRVIYKDNFHIDVPSYHLNEAEDTRALATEKNGWEFSDPKAIYVWFTAHLSDEYLRGKARRIIQYLKAWAQLALEEDKRPSSILLTVLVAEAIPSIHGGNLASDDDAVAAVVEKIIARLKSDSSVPNPVDGGEDLVERHADVDHFVDALVSFHETAERALSADSALESAEIWAELFQHMMPLPDAVMVERVEKGGLPATTFTPDVHVVARSRKNKAVIWRGNNSIGPITKDCDIQFSLANHAQLPAGADVFWTVRNEGAEAESKNDLGHVVGEGLGAEEKSAYKGTHYMDCIVRQFGKVVGFRRVPVMIMGHSTPLRNPPKPAYTSLRRKR